MAILTSAFETTATVDEKRGLVLDEPLPISGPARVRVVVLLPEDSDIEEREWLRVASANPAFDFLKDAEEDVYTIQDGRPFNDEG